MTIVYDRSDVTKIIAESSASIEAIRLEVSQILADEQTSASQRARLGELYECLASCLKRAEGVLAHVAGSQGVQLFNDYAHENGMGDGRTIRGTQWEESRLHDEAAAYFRAATVRRRMVEPLPADSTQERSSQHAH
ncbi:MAG TPA: hypothetical protein VGO61_06980 [Steroidobacteraceae bacterium]|jgi:hypothetical protein|nr:hypothetical protein [Steroidobacteraceae bacterium]